MPLLRTLKTLGNNPEIANPGLFVLKYRQFIRFDGLRMPRDVSEGIRLPPVNRSCQQPAKANEPTGFPIGSQEKLDDQPSGGLSVLSILSSSSPL